MKFRHMLALAMMVAGPPAYAAENPAIETFTLKNGLEVIVIPNHRVPAVSHMIWYKVGGGDDPSGKSGLAHYHEHMMFEGTPKLKAGEYAEVIARNGGQQNASTGHDATSYYINISKEGLPLAMALEADRMAGLNPSDAGAAKEKEVIIEERRERIENNPEALLWEQMSAALYRNHPYHWPVIGWMNEMKVLTKDDVIKFHNTWYHPNNAVLVINGDVTAAEVKPLAEKYYGPLPRADIPARHWNDEPPQIAARRIVMHHPNVKQATWSRMYEVPSLNHGKKEEVVPLILLGQILGGGETSRLYQSLVVEQKLALSVDAEYGDAFAFGPSDFVISFIPESGVAMEDVEKALDKEIGKAAQEGFAPEEIARAKTLLKAETIYQREGLNSIANIVGSLRVRGLSLDYFTKLSEMIDKIGEGEIRAALKDTLVPEQSVTGILLPPETVEAEAAGEPAKKDWAKP